jgi:ferric-dicitrate binding protein FerR (iron transport regulator)
VSGPDFEGRMGDHRRWYRRRLQALRGVVSRPGGRDRLRAIRRAAASPQPRSSPRRPALALAALFAGVLLALWLAERAGGH